MRPVLGCLGLVALVLSAGAQEYGRGSLAVEGRESGLGRAPLPQASNDSSWGGGVWGVKAGLGWALVDWDLGPASGSDGIFAPQASLFYTTTDRLDVNVSAAFFSAQDEEGPLGEAQADMTRLALGLRYWFHTKTRATPYAGAGIGYYLLEGETDMTRDGGIAAGVQSISMDNWPGAFLEGGVAFQVADNLSLNAEITYDFLLGPADAEINGESEDFNVRALAFNLGATWVF